VIIFGLVWFLSKKVIKLKFFKKKPKLIQTDRVQFGSVQFFRKKISSNRFGSVFSVWLGFRSVFSGSAWFWLGFFGLARFFSGFFRFGFGSVFSVLSL